VLHRARGPEQPIGNHHHSKNRKMPAIPPTNEHNSSATNLVEADFCVCPVAFEMPVDIRLPRPPWPLEVVVGLVPLTVLEDVVVVWGALEIKDASGGNVPELGTQPPVWRPTCPGRQQKKLTSSVPCVMFHRVQVVSAQSGVDIRLLRHWSAPGQQPWSIAPLSIPLTQVSELGQHQVRPQLAVSAGHDAVGLRTSAHPPADAAERPSRF